MGMKKNLHWKRKAKKIGNNKKTQKVQRNRGKNKQKMKQKI